MYHSESPDEFTLFYQDRQKGTVLRDEDKKQQIYSCKDRQDLVVEYMRSLDLWLHKKELGWTPKASNLNDSIDKIPIWDNSTKYVYMTDANLYLTNTDSKERYCVRIALTRSMMIVKFTEADKSVGSRSD